MAIRRVFIANRGEIAVRIIRTCKQLGIETVLAVSAADRDSLPARLADRAVCVGPARSSDSYLLVNTLIHAALATGCDAVMVITEWNEFKQLDLVKLKSLLKSPVIYDGRNIYDPATVRALGYTYRAIGR